VKALNRYLHLAQMVIEGRGVPFLGAGISFAASIPPDNNESDTIETTINWMIGQLINSVLPRLTSKEKKANLLFSLTGKTDIQDPKKKLEDRLKEWVSDRLGLFCGALIQQGLLSHREIVNSLKIDRFADLNPTPAHFFIAFLVRETLINEVITTNYDCCIERAIYRSLGKPRGNGQPSREKAKLHPTVSIHDLPGYRQHSSRRLIPFNHGTVLRVYKINGCAGELKRNPSHYRRILLADTHLQHMDDRGWARDLLRDRIRSRSLIFSGFGSDEPQVRFIVARLLEEFQQQDNNNEYADSIWIQSYDKYPTHTQQQFLNLWPGGTRSYHNRKRFFSGEDTKTIHKYCGKPTNSQTDNSPTLSADLFWQTLFQLIFLALFDRYTSPGTPGFSFLAGYDEPSLPYMRRSILLNWLDPARLGQKILTNSLLKQKNEIDGNPLQRIDRILGCRAVTGTNETPSPGIPLCLWLRALHNKSLQNKEGEEYYYLPLLNNIEVILSLLSLCCFTADQKKEFPFIVNTSNNTPFLYFCYKNYEDYYPILLLASAKKELIREAAGQYPQKYLIAGIHESNSLTFTDRLKPFFLEEESNKTIRLKYIVPVPISDLLSCLSEQPEKNTGKFLLALRTAKRARSRPSQNAKLKKRT